EIAQQIYDGGLVNEWQDWGWSPHEMPTGQPARVRFEHWGGWILAKPGLTGDYGGLVFRVKTTEAEFLQVRVESNGGNVFPRVNVSPIHHRALSDGWSEVFLSIGELDPDGLPFDRVVLHTFRDVGSGWVLIDKVALTKPSGGPPAAALVDPATLPQAPLAIQCAARATKINPMIYGMAYYAPDEPEKQKAQWLLDATARRWGGNTMSTYNYEVSAWNAGNDWFFENLDVSSYTYASFLKDNAAHGMASALTVPMMGWVAKDGTSSSFPVSVFGQQQAVDQWRQDAGNGKRKSGDLIRPGPQSRAYVPITPAFVKKWVETIRQEDAKTGKRSVQMYILDNEPVLWNTTHRDAHPEPLSYDELIQRTIDYGTAIREADPDAVIAGPAEWGWSGYLYSARDLAAGVSSRPDRRAHGDLPLVAYYLRALAAHEKATGVRVLDVLDLHGYPYADRVGGSAAAAETAELRLRTTRMLWDPSYVDESWVKEPVRLLPRMREWVDQNYPGRGLSIGEWNFGGEEHISGGLATAEALGRFGQFGLTSAFYWVYPPANSPTMWAFRAYRNYDGKGAHFLEWSVPTSTTSHISLFASRDDSGGHLVAIALNLSKTDAVAARIDVSSCGKIASRQVYSYAGGGSGFAGLPPSTDAATAIISQSLAPFSITVIDVRLTDASPVAK
ncbi:MAG: glycoside hydrolase family 44 protein, partial [Myxococcota bacterium]|nr:glycoside hydrolase family 44 protein [Myxococcota bacterium]